MGGSILGNRVLRTEDPELLVGGATYVADLPFERPLHVVFVRSEMAHALITNIDVDEARTMPGVAAVWTADDLGLSPHHGFVAVHDDFARPPLADERVRFVGEAVAAVAADTQAHALDAAAAVIVDYEPLDVVVDPEAALATDAPLLYPDRGHNLALEIVDRHVVDLDAISDVVVRGRYENQRMAGAPMETNSCAAVLDVDGRLTFWVATQMPHLLHGQLAGALGIDADLIRVIAPHVGGGFGAKAGLYHEHTVVAALAVRLRRAVTWTPTRSDDMVSLAHSRAQVQYAELGSTSNGTFTGLRVRLVGDAGAYPSIGAYLPGGTRRMSQGTYAFPAIQFDVAVPVTNTTPTGAYRGAGRPEATALLERLIDQAARELGIDPIELRLRNFLGDDVFPYRTLTGATYDSGGYAAPLRVAAAAANYTTRRAEQSERRARGDRWQLGIGVAAYVEVTAGGGTSEYGAVEVHDDGMVTVRCGTSAHGQGHQTAYAMLVSAQTGIAVESIRLVQSDTDLVRSGGGTGGSRSLQLGGTAVHRATEAMVDKARHLAAHLLEADVADVVVDTETATVGVSGVPATALTWAELAAAAATAPAGVVDHSDDTFGLAAQLDVDQGEASYPFGAHICIVEVDTETGQVRIVHHVAVDDCGTVLNPMLVEGQQHGGIAAGIGQALFEHVRYDDHGNPLTANFMDYLVPSAADLPSFDVRSTETPTPLNPLGAKGIGEAATIGSTPAVQNAIIDAVSHLGVRHIDMPCTPERVWAAVVAATGGVPTDPWREPPAWFSAKRSPAGELDVDAARAAEGI